MIDTRPYALIVARDEQSRGRIAAALRESGFVVVAFRESRGALAALAARPVDIAIVEGQADDGDDALGTARQLRHCRPGGKVLFAGPTGALPAAPDPDSGRVVTSPYDKRRLLSAVFELLARDGNSVARREEAERGLMAARLACLRSRWAGLEGWAAAQDIAYQIETAMAARGAGEPPEAG